MIFFATASMPAPLWFVQFFKVVGFVLHMIPMGIWFVGLPVAIGCALWNCPHSGRFAWRLVGQLPVFMALGINFAIVPLLFLQTTYFHSFYTATILMSWHWLAVIPILIVGYYALYLAAFSRKEPFDGTRNGRMIVFCVVASLCLTAIGILITNGLTLMVRSDLWPAIMARTDYYGATTGLANNMRDPAVWIRLVTMFGLGLATTGVWAAFDSHFLLPKQNNEAYQRWTLWLAVIITHLGIVIVCQRFVPIQSVYPNFFFVKSTLIFTGVLLAVSLVGKVPARVAVGFAVLCQVFTLALFGIVRQMGQDAGVAKYVDVSAIPVSVQWSPLIAFLITFVFGLVVIAWMVWQCVKQSVSSNRDYTVNGQK